MRTARTVGLIAALVIFGNAKTWWDLVVLQTTAAGSTFGIGAGIALVLAILVAAPWTRTSYTSLGLSGSWRSGVRLGLWVGGTAALAGGVLIVGGSLVARGLGLQLVDVAPAASVPWGPLLWRALLLLWVDTAIPEELAFRGALLLALDASLASAATVAPVSFRQAWVELGRAAVRPAVILSSVVFAAWHVVVVIQDGDPQLPTVLGKLIVIAIGGLLFGGLRVIGGTLLAPILGHWLFDMVAMIAARLAVGL